LREAHERYRIVTEAWSPLRQGKCLTDPTLKAIVQRHGRTPAQILLRWHIESGFVAIPKSPTPTRMAENIDVFGFELTREDRAAIAGLDSADGRTGPDPVTFGGMPRLPRLSPIVVTRAQRRHLMCL
jgi:2,5-diketo-D-gluconate reductase A